MTRAVRGASMSGAIAAILLAAFPPSAVAVRLTDCKCDDVREMRDRWCSARAARSEYERIQRSLETETAKSGKPRMFSNADKNMITEVCAQEAINATSDKGVGKATARMNENTPLEFLRDDCRIEVTSTKHTACQKQIVEAHEAVHSLACFARRGTFQDMNINVRTKLQTAWYGASNMAALNLTGDTKYMMTSAQYASEEAAGYATEAQLISYRWRELQEDCMAEAFQIEIEPANASQVGQQFWNNISPDATGKKIYKVYDLSNSPCPNHPRPSPSQCTIK